MKVSDLMTRWMITISPDDTVEKAIDLMKKNKIKMNDAYKLVHTGRPCIGPNLGFCGQLMSYEQELML